MSRQGRKKSKNKNKNKNNNTPAKMWHHPELGKIVLDLHGKQLFHTDKPKDMNMS
jgi:hypothetical protein